MKLKKLTSLLLAGTLALGLAGCGSAAPENPEAQNTLKVGVVQYDRHSSLDEICDALTRELETSATALAGLGTKLEVTVKNGQGDAATINDICTLFLADKVDLVVAIATPAAAPAAAALQGSDIPLVFSAVTDPVAAQLVDSMEAPGGSITGTSDYIDTQAIFNLALTQNPQLKKLGILYNLSEPNSVATVEKAVPQLEEKGVEALLTTVSAESEVQMAVHDLISEGAQAIFVPIDNTVANAMSVLADEAIRAGLPVYTAADSLVRDGGLATVGVNYTALGEETAHMVTDILVNGKDPAQMPVRVLEDQIVTVNTTTAKALSIDPDVFDQGNGYFSVE